MYKTKGTKQERNDHKKKKNNNKLLQISIFSGLRGCACFQIPHPSLTGKDQTDQDFVKCGCSDRAESHF